MFSSRTKRSASVRAFAPASLALLQWLLHLRCVYNCVGHLQAAMYSDQLPSHFRSFNYPHSASSRILRFSDPNFTRLSCRLYFFNAVRSVRLFYSELNASASSLSISIGWSQRRCDRNLKTMFMQAILVIWRSPATAYDRVSLNVTLKQVHVCLFECLTCTINPDKTLTIERCEHSRTVSCRAQRKRQLPVVW